MSLSARLFAVFNVRHDERHLVAQVFLFSLLLAAGSVLTRTAAFAIFLAELGSTTLPYVYIASSVAGVLVTFVFLRFSNRFSLSAVTIGTVLLLLMVTALFWVALRLNDHRLLFFALPIYASLVWTLQSTLFWNLLGRLFTLQQGKRLFGLLGSGESIAAIVAGLLAPLVVGLAGTANLLLMAAVTLAGALLIFALLARRFGVLLAGGEAEEESAAGTGKAPLRSRYIILIFAIVTVSVLGYYLLDNVFYIEVEGFLSGQDSLASFLGVFFGFQGGLGLALQLLVAGRVLERYGVRPLLLATPLVLALWMVPYVVLGRLGVAPAVLFGLAIGAYMYVLVADVFDSAVYSLLYQVMPAEERVRVQTLASGVIDPIATGLAGMLLIVLYDFLGGDVSHTAALLLAVLAVWLLVGLLLARQYPAQVQRALRKRLLGGDGHLPPERASLELIRDGLRQTHVGTLLYTLDLLEQGQPDALGELAPPLIAHPSAAVRAQAVGILERHQVSVALPALLRRRGEESDASVRRALERAIAALSEDEIVEAVGPSLQADDPAVRVGAMTGLLRSGDMDALLVALETLQAWMADPDPAIRLLAAESLHDAEITSLYRPVLRLMDDSDLTVRRRSIQTAARLKHRRLWPNVIDHLDVVAEREMAMNALVAGGAGAMPAINDAARRPMQPGPDDRARLMRLIRAAGRIEADAAVTLLLDLLDVPDFEIHTQALRSLRRVGYRALGSDVVQAYVATEVARATWLLQACADLTAGPELNGEEKTAAALLLDTLEDSVVRQQRNVFHCLAFGYGTHLIREIEDNFYRSGEGRGAREGRALAREMIEVHISSSVRHWIRPLLDDPPALSLLLTHFPQPEMSRCDRLRQLAADMEVWPTAWVQACALYWLGAARMPITDEVATTALQSPEPIVRETAAWALHRLYPVCPPVVFELLGDPNPQCAAYARSILGEDSLPMLTTIEKVLALRGVELFSETPDAVLADLVALLRETSVSAGQPIFAKDDDGRSMFVIATGNVRIHDGDHDFSRLSDGEVFGEMALLDPAPRSASATALSDTVLLELQQEPFFELLEDHVSVSRHIMELLTRRLRTAMSMASTS